MTLPIVLSLVIALLAVAHAWWAKGRIPPAASASALAHAVIGEGNAHACALAVCRRRRGACRHRGLALGDAALARQPTRPHRVDRDRRDVLPARHRGLQSALARAISASVRTLDFYLYSPLCLALGVGFIKLLTNEMH